MNDNCWTAIPLREFPAMCAIRDARGEIIATVRQPFVEPIVKLPELLATCRMILEANRFEDGEPSYSDGSLMGRLESLIEETAK